MKFESFRTARRHWLIGIGVALVGVLLARVIAPNFSVKTAAVFKVIGQFLAIAGLFVIAVGIKRRTSSAPHEEQKSK